MTNNRYCLCLMVCFILSACSTASSIQRADQSNSAFDGAVYSGTETVIRDDVPDSQAFRIFHQGATGFVSVSTVRLSAVGRAKDFCEERGLRYELLREHVSAGAHIAGNFPRAELVFTCMPKEGVAASASFDSTSPDRYKELRELKSLLDDGILTKEEYEKEKGKLLEK